MFYACMVKNKVPTESVMMFRDRTSVSEIWMAESIRRECAVV